MKFRPYMIVIVLLALFFLFSFSKSGYDVESPPGFMLTPGPVSDNDGSDMMMMPGSSATMTPSMVVATMAPSMGNGGQSFMCKAV